MQKYMNGWIPDWMAWLLISIIAYINSCLFVVLDGRHHQIAMQIGAWGLVINISATFLAWRIFIRKERSGAGGKCLAIFALSLIHYLLLSNVMSVLQ